MLTRETPALAAHSERLWGQCRSSSSRSGSSSISSRSSSRSSRSRSSGSESGSRSDHMKDRVDRKLCLGSLVVASVGNLNRIGESRDSKSKKGTELSDRLLPSSSRRTCGTGKHRSSTPSSKTTNHHAGTRGTRRWLARLVPMPGRRMSCTRPEKCKQKGKNPPKKLLKRPQSRAGFWRRIGLHLASFTRIVRARRSARCCS